ncbi:MAG: coenzyme F420-0:L-glutamate ligase, partial [Eubacteriales bacterium]
MERLTGTISVGVRAPIIRKGDDICQIVSESVIAASESSGLTIDDRDVVGVTEAVVARAQGNYASVDQIAGDIRSKFGNDTVGVIFPILSRNRFAICLKGIAMGCKKIVLMLSFPSDEVGNHLIDLDSLDAKGITVNDVMTEQQFRDMFGVVKHPFTGVDYIEYYRQLITEQNCEVEIVLANDCREILKYTKSVLCCDIHSRARTKRLLKEAGAEKIYGLDDILSAPYENSGYNEKYGLL